MVAVSRAAPGTSPSSWNAPWKSLNETMVRVSFVALGRLALACCGKTPSANAKARMERLNLVFMVLFVMVCKDRASRAQSRTEFELC